MQDLSLHLRAVGFTKSGQNSFTICDTYSYFSFTSLMCLWYNVNRSSRSNNEHLWSSTTYLRAQETARV